MERAKGNLSKLTEISLSCRGALLSQVLKLAFWGKDLRKPRSPVRAEAYHVWMKKAAGICPNLEKQTTLPWQLWISTRQPGMPLNIMLNSSMRKKKQSKRGGSLREKEEDLYLLRALGHGPSSRRKLQNTSHIKLGLHRLGNAFAQDTPVS